MDDSTKLYIVNANSISNLSSIHGRLATSLQVEPNTVHSSVSGVIPFSILVTSRLSMNHMHYSPNK